MFKATIVKMRDLRHTHTHTHTHIMFFNIFANMYKSFNELREKNSSLKILQKIEQIFFENRKYFCKILFYFS